MSLVDMSQHYHLNNRVIKEELNYDQDILRCKVHDIQQSLNAEQLLISTFGFWK